MSLPMPPIERYEPRYDNDLQLRSQVELIPKRRKLLHLVLFLVTFATTTLAGAFQKGVDPFSEPNSLLLGLTFSVPLMLILLCHEMGHYLMARRHGVRASLPYFLPAPPFPVLPIGTFGAFIRMRSLPADRRILFDIGAAGPWGGIAIAVPAVVIGLYLSEIRPLNPLEGGLFLGDSLLFSALTRLVLGVSGNDVNIELHPIALAGWFGLFVTFLNLLPVGQLDGGHVIYSLFGRLHRWISRGFLMVIFFLGFHGWLGWFFWVGLLAFLGVDHPPTHDFFSSLDLRRKVYAWSTVILFALTFMPVPFSVSEPPILQDEEAIPIAYIPDRPKATVEDSFHIFYRP